MPTPDYSIGLVTYLGRYETYFQPFMRELVGIFADKEIIVFVNGHYDIVQQTAYLKKVTAFLSEFRNVRYVTHLEHQSLARGWNHLVWMASHPRVLICNDDLRIEPLFRQDMEQGLLEHPDHFVINRSWSHFIMAKRMIAEVGWFDERFKGVGYEDGDYMIRLVAADKALVSVACRGVNNIVAKQENAGWANQSGITRGKHSMMNEDFLKQKYESNFTGKEERQDDNYKIRFPWNGEILKATLREGMETPVFYPFSIINDRTPAPHGNAKVNRPVTASDLEKNTWQQNWEIAQAARCSGDVSLTDLAAQAVLRANPQFWFARELPKHVRGYYSQFGQDQIIEQFFNKYPARAKVFVEVGAFDGVHYSNVRRLHERYGWIGLSIEPVQKNFEKLCRSYQGSRVKCVRAAVSDEEGQLEMNVSTYPHLPDWGSDTASLSGGDKERWTREYGVSWKKETVAVKTLTTLLQEAAISEVDFLSVDAEGCDLAVLKSLDFSRFHPQLIIVEYGEERDAILRFLSEQGYSLHQDNGQDLLLSKPLASATDSGAISDNSSTKPVTPTLPKPKIVGLVPGRNEASRLPFCLRALARFTDAIVYLDDASEDNSIKVVEALAAECRVEKILRKDKWYLDEPGDRNKLLAAGRGIGGTHFVAVDADEAFTANFADNDYLRKLILALLPGDQIEMNWIQLWRSVDQYRFDSSVWTWNYKGVIFRDDGNCSHSSAFVHTPRVPGNLSGRVYRIPGYNHGLMHFQFINWRNLLVKQAWYRCLEHVRNPQKPVNAINERYAPSKDETKLGLRAAPASWLAGYEFFDLTPFNEPEWWREKQVRAWFKEYGKEHFKDLDIWDIDWSGEVARIPSVKGLPTPGTEDLSERAVPFVDQAEICNQQNDVNGARDTLVHALDWAPDFVDLVLAAAAMHLRAGDARSARWEAQRAAVMQPENPLALIRLAEAAAALDLSGEFEAAMRRVLELLPNDADALQLLGDQRLKQERLDEAVDYFTRIVTQNPQHLYALLRLGVCFFKKDDYRKAGEYYGKVLQLDPNHKIARENLAFIEKEMERAKSATLPKTVSVESAPAGNPALVVTDKPKTLLSAIVSTYKSERFIEGCLEDLVGQTLFKRGQLEIVVVDSCSPEKEGAVVKCFQERFKNIVYVRTNRRETLYAAWNRAIRGASGEYITNTNTDDRHRNDALEIMAGALSGHPEVSLVYSDCLLSTTPNEPFDRNSGQRIYRYPQFFAPAALLHYQFGPQPMWRKAVHETVGLFEGTMRAAGDYDFNLRFARAFNALHIPEILGSYLAHEGAISFADTTMAAENQLLAERYQQDAMIEALYARSGVRCATNAEKALVHLDLGMRAVEYFPPWKEGQKEANYGLAAKCFARSLALDPRRPHALNNFFCILAWTGKRAEALSLFESQASHSTDPTLRVNYECVQRPDFFENGHTDLVLMPSGLGLPTQRQLAFGGATAGVSSS
ncbi:MAG: FkbM family methyltransferase [Nibricoccus sp.]